MPAVRRLTTAVIVAALAALALAAAAQAGQRAPVAHGTVGGKAWRLSARAKTMRSGGERLPLLCVGFAFALAPGEPAGNRTPVCIGPSRGIETRRGLHFVFDMHAGPLHGVFPMVNGGQGDGNVRGIVLLVDPRARVVTLTLSTGHHLRLRAHPLPRSIHRAARIAYHIDGGSPTVKVTRATAYRRHHRVVGRYRAKH